MGRTPGHVKAIKKSTVEHGAGELIRGNVHTNTAEGFFSQLKRSLDGTYHHVSKYHLHRYLAEFDHRYNTCKDRDSERMEMAIRKARGKRLMDLTVRSRS